MNTITSSSSPRTFVGLTDRRRIDINGVPGLLMTLNGQVQYAFSFEVVADRVRAIYILCNPDKLRHLTTPRDRN